MSVILQLGEPLLHQIAQPVADFSQVEPLVDELLSQLHQTQGVGIAAPQIGVSLQAFIIASRPNARYPQAPLMEPLALVNPRLLSYAPEIVWGWEGCLSVPDQRGFVPRQKAVEVVYFDLKGQEHTVVFEDFVARIFQHEYDHLLGKVFLERSPQLILSEAEYQRSLAP